MTVIKATSQERVILNFNGKKCSKNHIKRALHQCEIVSVEIGKTPFEYVKYDNRIIVGMYCITLFLPFDSPAGWHKLKDYRDFAIVIHDTDKRQARGIDLKKDSRFKDQYWVSQNFFGKLRIKHLVDIIAHCHRLHQLRAFL